jgi:hypothetical protein
MNLGQKDLGQMNLGQKALSSGTKESDTLWPQFLPLVCKIASLVCWILDFLDLVFFFHEWPLHSGKIL